MTTHNSKKYPKHPKFSLKLFYILFLLSNVLTIVSFSTLYILDTSHTILYPTSSNTVVDITQSKKETLYKEKYNEIEKTSDDTLSYIDEKTTLDETTAKSYKKSHNTHATTKSS